MTIAALTQRLLRHWRVDDVASLAADDALALLDAINGALQEAYAILPVRHLQRQIVVGVDEPVNITVAVTNGSTAVTMPGGFTDTAGALRIAGDAILHRLAGAGTLAAPFDGPTGSVPATFYHDAHPLPVEIARLLGGPTVLESSTDLVHGMPYPGDPDATGEVLRYWFEAQPIGNDYPLHLRLWPLPASRCRVAMAVEIRPPKVTLRQLASAAPVPFHDRLIESAFLPLCASRMVFSPRWADASQRDAAMQAAETARTILLKSMPDNVTSTPNRVGTPEGY